MALSPNDIRKTEFTRRLRGLDPDEVGAYLELVAREVEMAQQEVRMREERIHDLEGRLQHYERIELALEEALRTTRESSRQVMEAAHQKAERVQAEAEEEATRIQSKAAQENRRLRQEAQAIAVRRKEVVARLRAFLMSEMEVLAHFEGEDPVGFIKLMPGADAQLGAASGDYDLPAAAPRDEAPEPAQRRGMETDAALTAPPVVIPVVDVVDDREAGAGMPEAADAAPWAPFATPAVGAEASAVPLEALPPEFEAYFAPLPSGATPAESHFTAAPAEVDRYFPQDLPMAGEAHLHAPEPGEAPVPEELPASWGAPEGAMGWPAADASAPEPPADDRQAGAPAPAWPAFEAPALMGDELAPTTPAPSEPEAGGTGTTGAAPPASFDVRAVRRDRYQIETLVGPTVPAPRAADADQSEESAHLRRLLDGLD